MKTKKIRMVNYLNRQTAFQIGAYVEGLWLQSGVCFLALHLTSGRFVKKIKKKSGKIKRFNILENIIMELNWENANAWQEKANAKKEIYDEPKWNWDCNFKLDFDGSLLRISSRFNPPHKNAGDWWEGAVTVNLLGEEVLRKEFKCETLDKLKKEVEKFTKHYSDIIKSRLINGL